MLTSTPFIQPVIHSVVSASISLVALAAVSLVLTLSWALARYDDFRADVLRRPVARAVDAIQHAVHKTFFAEPAARKSWRERSPARPSYSAPCRRQTSGHAPRHRRTSSSGSSATSSCGDEHDEHGPYYATPRYSYAKTRPTYHHPSARAGGAEVHGGGARPPVRTLAGAVMLLVPSIALALAFTLYRILSTLMDSYLNHPPSHAAHHSSGAYRRGAPPSSPYPSSSASWTRAPRGY